MTTECVDDLGSQEPDVVSGGDNDNDRGSLIVSRRRRLRMRQRWRGAFTAAASHLDMQTLEGRVEEKA